MQLLLAQTRDAARALGDNQVGTIEPEKRADLMLLSADPIANPRNLRRVERIMRGGEWADSR
jgi:imidazolonepropionase-like amidohydrolase